MRDGEMIVAAGMVVIANAALFGAAEIWRKRGTAMPESTRKLVHVGAGLLALPLPWIFESHLPVLLMAAIFTVILTVTRLTGMLRSVHGVERISLGEIIYPGAVYATFLLTVEGGYRELYPIPILALALGDAAAGLVGVRYGRHRYKLLGGSKSIEGSLAFFAICFASSLTVLLTGASVSPASALWISAVVAALGTLVEAMSTKGTDNFTVPMAIALATIRLVELNG